MFNPYQDDMPETAGNFAARQMHKAAQVIWHATDYCKTPLGLIQDSVVRDNVLHFISEFNSMAGCLDALGLDEVSDIISRSNRQVAKYCERSLDQLSELNEQSAAWCDIIKACNAAHAEDEDDNGSYN